MCHARKYVASNSLLTIYNSLFLPHINYCILIWASTYSSHTQPLVILQKKAIRIITHSPLHAHTKPLFVKINTLPFSSIFKFQMSSFVFSHINKRLPPPLSSFLHLNFDYHEYLTCSRFNVHKTFLKQHVSLCAQAPIIWNDIPLSLRNTLSSSNADTSRICLMVCLFLTSTVSCHIPV